MIERLARSPIAVAALVIVAAGAGAGATWLWQHGSGGDDRARIERIVHDYVLDHPEILPQAMRNLQDRETGQVIAANRDQIFTPLASAWAGNPDPDLTIVEYFDYNCGFCRASLPTIADLLQRDRKLRIVFRELPVLSQASDVAARLSIVAARAGKFGAFHEALYKGGPLSDATMDAALRTAGLDPAKVRAEAQDPSVETEIKTNYAVAKQLGITGTPSWVIGDHVVSAALPLDELEKEIAKARARG